jgi:hypothetical protein
MSIADAFEKIGFGKVKAVAGGVYALDDSVIARTGHCGPSPPLVS